MRDDSQKKNVKSRSKSRKKVLKAAAREQTNKNNKNNYSTMKPVATLPEKAAAALKSAEADKIPQKSVENKQAAQNNAVKQSKPAEPSKSNELKKQDNQIKTAKKSRKSAERIKQENRAKKAEQAQNKNQPQAAAKNASAPKNKNQAPMPNNIQEIRRNVKSRALKKPGEAKPKKKSKLLKVVLLVIAEALVLGVIFSYAYVLDKVSRVQRPEFNKKNVVNNDLSVENIKRMEGYRNIAIFGVDTRDNSVSRGNSDVIIIASINQANGEIKLVSVFRDTYMSTGNDKYNKINNAYAVGGPEQALKAINKNLDLNITEYVTFSWRAVATGINILGGVDLEITKAEHKYINSYITETVKSTKIGSVQIPEPGMHHLDGIQAVAYGRLRYMDSDFARTERQRKIIALALEKAKNADIKTLNDLLGNMLEMVATNLTWQDGLDVISDVKLYHIGETAGFPFARGAGDIGRKGDCVIPQTLESNVRELHKFLFGTENYEPSETVKNISRRISSDSGMYKEGKYTDREHSDKDYEPGEGSASRSSSGASKSSGSGNYGSGSSGSGSSKASTRKAGEYGVDYETDARGETKWLQDNPDPDEDRYNKNRHEPSSRGAYEPKTTEAVKKSSAATSEEYIGSKETEKRNTESSSKSTNSANESTSEKKPSAESRPTEATAERKPSKSGENTSKANDGTAEKKPSQQNESKPQKQAGGGEETVPALN